MVFSVSSHANGRKKGGFFLSWILLLIQLTVTVIMGVYFYTQLKNLRRTAPQGRRECAKEMENLRRMRSISLTEPLSEHVRPKQFSDIIGQEEGIRSLMAILCGKNPQHVLIYGPPGVGKTCAARLALEAAKKSEGTPFAQNAPFIEMDATCVRFDERAIADPLIGSVHDPIYQGAGPLGVQGIPQPKPGAVSRAHGGVLFLDEIGEMHPIQMNKLLKVLEDRKVRFESAYYHPDDPGTPRYVHEIFKNGLPADFRLIGATTRSPEEISPALRSRCMEIFFRALDSEEVARIAQEAAERAGFSMRKETAALAGQYALCGRDAVNMVQMASGVAQLEGRSDIRLTDMEWVIESGHCAKRPGERAALENRIGAVHGLAVHGSHQGAVMEIEAAAEQGKGRVLVTGIVEEEELGENGHTLRRKSMAHSSARNVQTLLHRLGYLNAHTDVHINFPGGMPVDGPSAGAAMAVAAVSVLTGRPVDGASAMTGEISVQGRVLPVGGVPAKAEAAKRAGLSRVLVPRENAMERFRDAGIQVILIDSLEEALDLMLLPLSAAERDADAPLSAPASLSASPVCMQKG
ncbi:MAG: ATP-dependent protease LonB [Clostridia bacterium]|nr:ATP-dependent protease LonB [Clostridia bacterium]